MTPLGLETAPVLKWDCVVGIFVLGKDVVLHNSAPIWVQFWYPIPPGDRFRPRTFDVSMLTDLFCLDPGCVCAICQLCCCAPLP